MCPLKERQDLDFQGENPGGAQLRYKVRDTRRGMRMQVPGKEEVGFMFICFVWKFARGNPGESPECPGPGRSVKLEQFMVKRDFSGKQQQGVGLSSL